MSGLRAMAVFNSVILAGSAVVLFWLGESTGFLAASGAIGWACAATK